MCLFIYYIILYLNIWHFNLNIFLGSVFHDFYTNANVSFLGNWTALAKLNMQPTETFSNTACCILSHTIFETSVHYTVCTAQYASVSFIAQKDRWLQ